jgi:hypothetical protein
MALADMGWTEIGIHNVISEFLRADRAKFDRRWLPLIDNPNLANQAENHKRLRLLFSRSWLFWLRYRPILSGTRFGV